MEAPLLASTSPGEELDILFQVACFSSEHARRLVNIRDPSRGLKMIWGRAEETCGSPVATEHALFIKLENFPKMSYKNPYKVRELADLLMEVEAAKLDGNLPGLFILG